MHTTSPQLDVLTKARTRKLPWLQVADALLFLEGQSITTPDGRPWVQLAADLSGYTANQLRRMTRVASVVRRLVREGQLSDETALAHMPFSHLDTAVKILQFEPATALKVLRGEWIKPSYPALLETYQRLRETSPKAYVPMVAGKRAVRRFQDTALSLLQNAAFLHLGPERRLGRMSHPSRYANPDALIVTRHGDRVVAVDGIDCYALTGPSQRQAVVHRALQAAVEATFFDCFWAVFPDPEHATSFLETARELMLVNVGTIVIDAIKPELVGHVPPEQSQPFPDRRELWRTHPPLRLP